MFLWFVEGWLTISTIAYVIHCCKNKHRIEIMSVDKVLKEIKRKEENEKNSLF